MANHSYSLKSWLGGARQRDLKMELIVVALPPSGTKVIQDQGPLEESKALEVEASDRIAVAKCVLCPPQL